MNPTDTRDANIVFGPPKGWDPRIDGGCGSLSVRKGLEGRYMYHASTWKPSPEELARLNAGGVIELFQLINVQPPTRVSVVDPTTAPAVGGYDEHGPATP